MGHSKSLNQRHRYNRAYLRLLFNICRHRIFDDTRPHISLVFPQNMTANWNTANWNTANWNTANRNKGKRPNPMQQLQEISNPKIMCLPSKNFIESGDMSSFLAQSGIQMLDGNSLRQMQNSPRFQIAVQESPPPLSINQEVMLETEQQDEYATEDEIEECLEDGGESQQGEEVLHDHPQQQSVHNPALCCAECRDERQRFETLMMRKINQVLETVQGNRTSQGKRNEMFSLLPPMPFHDVAALQRFDNDLKETEEMRKQFKQKIQEIGGKTVQKIVKHSLEALIDDELAQRVVWVLGAEDKPKISKFHFPRIIFDVVRSVFADAKLKEIEARIADWFRRGGDRIKAVNIATTKRRDRNSEVQ